MQRLSLIFTAPRQVAVRQEDLPAPQAGQVLVRTLYSAISPGTERLIYRGEAPAGMAADSTIAALAGTLTFPLKYGYACVGRVVEVRPPAGSEWLDRLVFSFHPHESMFWARPADIHPLPAAMPPTHGLFLPNMETAVNFVHDGRPLLGEQVIVWGQGVVGLLTTALLARFPIQRLSVLDRYAGRRALALRWGAHAAYDPQNEADLKQLQAGHPRGADLQFELSGAPQALQQAIDLAGFHSRIIIGSWYGNKQALLDLGGAFHRQRVQLRSSQVSSIDPDLTGRWDKQRRLQTAWRLLQQLPVDTLISHRMPLTEASSAYQLLDQSPHSTLQIIFEHPQA